MYSCVSRRVGLLADIQLPHAVDAPAPLPLSQMTSPRMRNRFFSISVMMCEWSGTYGLRPTFAMLTHALPPGTSTLYVSANTRSSIPRYWSMSMSAS